ncbi:MAG: sulfatase [Puniceicoccaceae bacterium]
MNRLIYCLFALTTPLMSAPALYEGFDMASSPAPLASAGARSGTTSQGWLSDWILKEGTSRILAQDLSLAGLESTSGLVSSKAKTVAMRQMGETFTGDAYGSFRVRGSKLNPNSMMGLMFSLPSADPLNPKTSLLSFLASRWGDDLGAIVFGGKPVKVEKGAELREKETALVLWKIDNLPEAGKKADLLIQMWILNEEQVAHFAAEGMNEKALKKAKGGRKPDQVMQYLKVPVRGSKFTLLKGLVVSCFSTGVPKADFDEIRLSSESLADAAGVGQGAPVVAVAPPVRKTAKPGSPNILFITMDDMNWDSMGAYGCEIPDITPHMDSLAKAGMRFEYAYNQTSSCVPSRNTYQTGRYPHTSGVLSFFNVDADFQTLPEILRENGYHTGCVNKPRDTSITDDFEKYWDYHHIMTGGDKRGAPTYETSFNVFLDEVAASGRPFYCVVNIADPHKPFVDDPAGVKQGFNKFLPSKRFGVQDVTIPGFLPDNPEIHEEMRNYYNSVKRGDDCVGAVLETLEKRGHAEDTVIIFISDHGMPLPYAKSSLYADGLRTPWVIKWPDTVGAGTVDSEHLVSAIDFLPTVLDIAELKHPQGIQGKSVLPAVMGETVDGLERVYAEFNDNAGGLSFPMRAVHSKRYTYVFNAWGTGNHSFVSAATWHKSEGVMKRLSKTDPAVAERYHFLLHRCVEEFYDLEVDPFALNNLIDDPAYQEIIEDFRADMKAWMKNTNDYVLEAFLVRGDIAALDAWMEKADTAALKRAKTLQWKRYKNRAGGTGKNTALYKVN